MHDAHTLCVDIEGKFPKLRTHGPGTHRGDSYITGVGVGIAKDCAFYLPTRHPDMEHDHELVAKNKKILTHLLKSPNAKLGANIAFDYECIMHEGYAIDMTTTHDVQYAEPLLDEYAYSYSLDALAKKHTNEVKRTDVLERYADSMGWKGKAVEHLWRMPSDVVEQYVLSDITLPLEIFEKQKRQLEAENLWGIYTLETQLIPTLLRMRRNGVRLDMDLLKKTSLTFADKKYDLEQELYAWLGGELNLASSAQLARRFDQLGIQYPRREPTKLMRAKGKEGNPLLDSNSLKEISKTHPEIAPLLKYRHYNTLESMFLLPYWDFNVDGRLYGTFHPLKSDDYGTVSGRFSASKPNLQQVSAIDEDDDESAAEELKGRVLRAMFIPEEGQRWAKLDLSQIEYRIMAHYAKGAAADKLRRDYNEDSSTDMHQVICDLTGFDRRTAKRLNFGGAYGMGIETAANMFGWTMQEATDFMASYHNAAPYVKKLRNSVSTTAARRGSIYTLLGRKARTHSSRKLHSMFNRLIQGGASDVLKASMVEAEKSGVYDYLTLHMTVHDELDVSYHDDKAGNEALMELKRIMEDTTKINVPIICDCHTGINWAEAD